MRCRLWYAWVGVCSLGLLQFAQGAVPVVEKVEVTRTAVHNAPGWRVYTDTYRVIARDEDGGANITSITVAARGGGSYRLPPAPGGPLGKDAATGFLGTPESFAAPPEGPITVTVTDREGHVATLKTGSIGRPAFMEPVAPAVDSVITETKPVYRWKGAVEPTSLQLIWEAKPTAPVWETEVQGTGVVHNADGRATQAELRAGYTYVWVARSRQEQPSADPRVKVTYAQVLRARFSTYAAWPALPTVAGILLYGYYFPGGSLEAASEGVSCYNPDPHVRKWLGPVGISYPDVARDGKRLVYVTQQALWLDARDGSPPRRLADGFCRDPRWSPDMKQIAFVRGTNFRPDGSPGNLDLWIMNADGSGARPLANDPQENERFPCWSPDGKWIAYRSLSNSSPSTEETSLFAIRPDGRESRPVVGGKVVGHREYGPAFLDSADWSPDGRRLVATFSAKSERDDREELVGVGTFAPEGGPVTPVFISPPGGNEQTMPSMPAWSPDGKKIAFVSAHHLIGREGEDVYAGPEVWVMNADGTGEPVRLTYDHSRVNSIRWR